jgi:tetratricopeptide (TPR) repeat protein
MSSHNLLSILENSGLIYPTRLEPELEYLFKHALVQEAAYDSILKADRRALHFTIAQTLEQLYPSRLDEFAATLADHYERAEIYPQALDYYLRAGKAAAKLYANAEAISLFSRAVELMAVPESNATTKTVNDLFSQYGRALELSGKFEAAIDNYRQMQAEAIRRRDSNMEMDALIAQAVIQATPSPVHNIPQANSLCEQALTIANTLQDREAESRIYWILLIVHYFGRDYQRSIEYGEKSLEIARAINHRERMAFTLNDVARSYYSAGDFDNANAAIVKSRVLWEELGNLPMLADNLISFAEAKLSLGEFDESLALAQRGYDISKKINNSWGQGFALSVQSNAYWYRGDSMPCLDCLQRLQEIDPKRSPPFLTITTATTLMEIYVEMGAYNRAHSAVDILKNTSASADNILNGFFELAQAYIASARGDHTSAGGWLDTAKQKIKRTDPDSFASFYISAVEYGIAIREGHYAKLAQNIAEQIQRHRQRRMDSFLPLLQYWHSNALALNKQADDARSELNTALELSEQMGTRHWTWRIRSALADISAQMGDPAAESIHCEKARETIRYITEHAPEDLRASYLNLPEVQKVMNTP